MKKLKRYGCLCFVLLLVLSWAPVAQGAYDPNYFDDFESYDNPNGIIGGGIWAQLTNEDSTTIELPEVDGNHYLSLSSGSNSDCILLSNSSLYTAEEFKVTFRMSSTTPEVRANNDSCPQIILRVGGVNRRTLDFGYSCIRYGNTALATGVRSGAWYTCEMMLRRGVDENGKGMLSVSIALDGSTQTIELEYKGLSNNYSIQLGAKLLPAQNICLDDLQIYSMNPVSASLDADGQQQRHLGEPLTLTLDNDMVDHSTVLPSSIAISGSDSAVQEIRQVGDGIYQLMLAQPLEPNTSYTVTLPGIKSVDGGSPKPSSFSFHTRKSGLSATWEGEDFRVTNDGTVQEMAYVLQTVYQEGAMTSVSGESVTLASGESISYTPQQDQPIFVVNADMEPLETSAATEGEQIETSAQDLRAVFSEETQELTVSGKAARTAADQLVAVYVTNPGQELSLADLEGLDEAIQYVGVTKTDSDGYFSAVCTIDGLSGTYGVFVTTLEENWTALVDVRSANDVAYILNTVNTTDSAAEVAALFDDYGDILNVDFQLFDACEDKSFVFAGLLLTAKEQEGGKYTAVEDIIRDVRELTVLQCLNTAAEEELLSLMEQYKEQVRIEELPAYQVWQAADDTRKASVAAAVQKSSCATMSDYHIALSKELLLTTIAQSNQWAEVKEILETYSDVLGLEMTAYNSAGKPAYVAKQMVGKSYDLASLKSAFDGFVQEYKKSSANSGSSSGSGSGSGTGSAGSSSGRGTPVSALVSGQTQQPQGTEESTPTQPEIFSDLAEAQWAASDIRTLYEAGVINGFGDGTFRPNDQVSREEFLKMAMAVSSLNAESGSSSFSDVAAGAWYEPYVTAAADFGIVRGKEDGSFGIGEPIVRQDAAVMLLGVLRAAGQSIPSEGSIAYTDASEIAAYAQEAVSALTELGILNGMPGGLFAPGATCTRAEAAKMMVGIMEVIR